MTKPGKRRKSVRCKAGAAAPNASAAAVSAVAPDAVCAAAARVTVSIGHGIEIKNVEAMQRRVVASLDGGTQVRFDIGTLRSIDTAGVQLLIGLQREGVKRGAPIEFSGHSTALVQALKLLGIADTFHGGGHRD